jgi:hypothetical protein
MKYRFLRLYVPKDPLFVEVLNAKVRELYGRRGGKGTSLSSYLWRKIAVDLRRRRLIDQETFRQYRRQLSTHKALRSQFRLEQKVFNFYVPKAAEDLHRVLKQNFNARISLYVWSLVLKEECGKGIPKSFYTQWMERLESKNAQLLDG